MMLCLLSPGGTATQTEVMPYPCATHGWPCASVRSSAGSGQMAHQRQAGEQAGNRKHDRSDNIQRREPDLALLVEHGGIERECREGGVAAENAGHQEQPP